MFRNSMPWALFVVAFCVLCGCHRLPNAQMRALAQPSVPLPQGQSQDAAAPNDPSFQVDHDHNSGLPNEERSGFEKDRFPQRLHPGYMRVQATQQMRRMIKTRDSLGQLIPVWVSIGPRPTISGRSHWSAWTNAIAVDPMDPNTVYVGNQGSGVWKATDGGLNWSATGDQEASLEIGSLAVAPSNPNVVYAGTGFWNAGVGVLKSTDKANSWTLMGGPFAGPFGSLDGGYFIYQIAVHPTNPDIVLAGVFRGDTSKAGVYRSSDGGTSWNQVLSGGRGSALVFDPNNPNTVYAAIGELYGASYNGFYKSTDAGVTWVSINNGVSSLLPQSSEIRLTLSPTSPASLYGVITGSQVGTLAVVKSSDGGNSWTILKTPSASRAFQIAVSPKDPNLVFLGDLPLFRSMDGGQTWTMVSIGSDGISTFGDFRKLAFSGDGNVLYVGDDGGMWRTTTPSAQTFSWTPLNDTRTATLFYSPIAIHPQDVNIAFGGAQDLGILAYSGKPEWVQAQPCDGGATLIDPVDPNNVYATCNGIVVYKSIKGGAPGTWSVSATGIAKTDRAEFIPTAAMDPANPSRLFYGTFRLYQSVDAAQTWSPISDDLTDNCGGINSIATTAADSNTVYVGSSCGHVFVTNSSGSPQPIWFDRSAGLPPRALTRITADPNDAAVAYAMFNGYTWGTDSLGHVFRTRDAGLTWADISGNLPNISANDLAVDPEILNTLYVATNIGVFQTSNGGQTWVPLGTGLPSGITENIKFHGPSRILRAATLGRGMWDLFLPISQTSAIPSISTLIPSEILVGSDDILIEVDGSGFTPTSVVRLNAIDRATTFVNTSALRFVATAQDLAQAGAAPVTVFTPAPGGGTSSAQQLHFVKPVPVTATSVDSSLLFASTGIHAAPGQVFMVTASGSANLDTGGPYITDPTGTILTGPPAGSGSYNFFTSSADPVGVPPAPGNKKLITGYAAQLQGAPYGALVAGFSALSSPASFADFPSGFVLVGSNGTATAPSSGGYLFLAINDIDNTRNNSGIYSATISTSPLGNLPTFTATEVTNAASFVGGSVSPGAIYSIFGANLTTANGIALAVSKPLPKQLSETSVTVNGMSAPLFAVASVSGQKQVNFQVPFETIAAASASIIVTNSGISGEPIEVPVLRAQPGVFTTDGTSAVALHGSTLITPSSPAIRGETIVIYGTGLGPVTASPGTGNAASGTRLSKTTLTTTVTIGGIDAPVSFSGLAPGFVGLYQINAVIPQAVASGNLDLVITVNGLSSKPSRIAVR